MTHSRGRWLLLLCCSNRWSRQTPAEIDGKIRGPNSTEWAQSDESFGRQASHNPSVVGSNQIGPTESHQVVLPMPLSGALKQIPRPKWNCSLWSHHPAVLDKDARPKREGSFSPVRRRSHEHGCNITREHRRREQVDMTKLTARYDQPLCRSCGSTGLGDVDVI